MGVPEVPMFSLDNRLILNKNKPFGFDAECHAHVSRSCERTLITKSHLLLLIIYRAVHFHYHNKKQTLFLSKIFDKYCFE